MLHRLSLSLRTILLLWFSGLYLRLMLLVTAPLGPRMAEDLGLSATVMGMLTTLPVLMLASGAIAGAWVVARLGVRTTLIFALLLAVAGSIARAGTDGALTLLLATAVMGLGIAAMQTSLPSLVRQWTPGRVALATAIYMNGLLMGEVLAAGLTLPLVLPLTGDSWRLTLMVWSLPGLLVAAALYGMGAPTSRLPRAEQQRHHWLPDFRQPVVWAMGLVVGMSSTLFFGLNAYMANVLQDRGEGHLLASGLLLFNSAQVVASFLALRYAGRWLGQTSPLLTLTLVSIGGTLLFGFGSGWWALWAAFATSLCVGIVLILMVSLPAAMAVADRTAPLAAGMFTIGYALSFGVPLLSGTLVDHTGVANWALAPLLAVALLAVPACAVVGHQYRLARYRTEV
ncbi:MFS transporter [Natronospirillum operosum]|uniref:MFS transporter n=1 Tax=Natronospirillum operosum TaxID=2759953 RepID=A0A4Z0WFG3_9GAMM|nr:MFS transporter [Natronospirillum operosum]TGG93230.1 MFS transporter [Natronospirillum operosum]